MNCNSEKRHCTVQVLIVYWEPPTTRRDKHVATWHRCTFVGFVEVDMKATHSRSCFPNKRVTLISIFCTVGHHQPWTSAVGVYPWRVHLCFQSTGPLESLPLYTSSIPLKKQCTVCSATENGCETFASLLMYGSDSPDLQPSIYNRTTTVATIRSTMSCDISSIPNSQWYRTMSAEEQVCVCAE